MRPIVLNLLAEEQLAEDANVRDPVKISVLIAIGLLGIITGIGYWISWRAEEQTRAATAMQKRYDTEAARLAEGTGDLRTWRILANDMVAINNSRSLFAWQLAWLKDVVPETIVLRSVSLGVNTEVGAAPPTPGDTGPKGGKAARVAVTTERMLLRMEGQASCAKPEIEVDEFIKTIQTHPGIKANLEKVNLRSIARVASAPNESPSAQFVIECLYRGQPL